MAASDRCVMASEGHVRVKGKDNPIAIYRPIEVRTLAHVEWMLENVTHMAHRMSSNHACHVMSCPAISSLVMNWMRCDDMLCYVTIRCHVMLCFHVVACCALLHDASCSAS